MVTQRRVSPEEEQRFYDATDLAALRPGWRGIGLARDARVQPYLWHWADVEPLVLRSGDIVTPDRDVERRILRLANPKLDLGTTNTISCAIQLILPGEGAPAHRHTPTALRWILQGEGSYTTVEGDKCYMERGDLILTPSWTWHDHGNEGTGPMIWMDGLDTPLVRNLAATFFEDYPEDQQPVVGTGESRQKYASGALRPSWESAQPKYSPLWHYRWEPTYEALQRLAGVDASPFDDVSMEYSNPSTGGPVLNSMTCRIQLIRPGVRTRAHRHTTSGVYQVFEGQGYSIIDGQRFDWTSGDIFAVPSWAWHEFANESSQEVILFSIHDTPVMSALSLLWEEPYAENAGHQTADTVFSSKA